MSNIGPSLQEFLGILGFLLIPLSLILFIVGVVLLITKKHKAGKIFLIVSGCCLVISVGACGLALY